MTTAVRQPRICRFSMSGRDVLAYKHALTHAGLRDVPRRKNKPWYGPAMYDQVRRFQSRNHLAADGVIGPLTYARFVPHFDGYDRWLLAHTTVRPVVDATEAARRRVANLALYEMRQAPYIHYSMGGSRMVPVTHRYRVPIANSVQQVYTDCSAFATWIFWMAGCPDPNGRGYDGYGYTGTMENRGRPVFGSPVVGDLVFYGNPISHVAIYVGNWKVVSHGSEGGPYLLPIDYRHDRNRIRRYPLV